MKKHFYIPIIILIFSFKGLIAQDLTLKINAKNKVEEKILDKIDYQKNHKNIISLNLEIDEVSDYLKNIGYFTNTIDSIKILNNVYKVYFTLNRKIKNVKLKINTTSAFNFMGIEAKNNLISFPIKKLKSTLVRISNNLDKKGKSFSKVQLKNIKIKEETIYADLEIIQSKKRIIDKVVIKRYNKFPKSYINNYFNIKQKTIFSQKKIKEISQSTKNLKFITEIKPPEVLFTKDSTFLYIYLKKRQNNSFDGIVSFASKENGDLLFNGNIDLKLNNILNTGEKFELYWNSIGEERQEFKLATEIPYVFKSKLTPSISFSIYKQDSTFLNTKFDSKLSYSINQKIKVALTYNSESSENLKEKINNNIETFNNYFVGFQLKYNLPKNDFFFNDKIYLEINPTIGKREANNKTSNQFKIEATASYIWDLSPRSNIFIKNKTGYLNSDTFIDNELFRIGGANSIRGFNEQSIFTNNFTYFNIEYRYLTSEKSYLYTITDFGRIKNSLQDENIIGVGAGYLFIIKNSLVNIGYALGSSDSSKFNEKNSKIIINWKSFF